MPIIDTLRIITGVMGISLLKSGRGPNGWNCDGRRYAMRILVSALLITVVSPGCTAVALKRATLSHAASSTDLRYKQAIENLAMSAADPDILPAYSSIYAGTTDVNDNVRATSASVWARTAQKPFRFSSFFSTQTADFVGSRAVKSNWTLDPTVVPEKLRAMRAACRWVTIGPENVGPDMKYLMAYRPAKFEEPAPSPPEEAASYNLRLKEYPFESGYYFDVADQLAGLPPGWLHCENRQRDVPRDACFWAGCHGKFVWVGPEGMASLSQFVLILQKIARVDFSSAYYPRTRTRKVKQNFQFVEGGKTYFASATFYLDENGLLTSGDGVPAIPMKTRIDNVGLNSDLRSVINAAAKSSTP
jgi:hypothetical protein